ncbi:hypothetical protein B0H67DRAFT_324628 [Lasiosphaeris hirsuta]|uniref:LITAF domain-containing protein n=1 Tax=Lasiosphaeris hirsuta TaxID=260670 RepID=A0AA40A252_9PEZI|nr:hypothetical protein B0H67DRAFT_324628 [Lasiosphaeris hirsuta]
MEKSQPQAGPAPTHTAAQSGLLSELHSDSTPAPHSDLIPAPKGDADYLATPEAAPAPALYVAPTKASLQAPAPAASPEGGALPPAYSAAAGPSVPRQTLSPNGVGVAPRQEAPMTAEQGTLYVTPLEQLTAVQGGAPQFIDCPFCHQRSKVRFNTEGTPMQILVGILLCILCIFLACLPCCAGWFEETNFFCSKCNKMVAKRDDHGRIQVFGPQVLVPSQMV